MNYLWNLVSKPFRSNDNNDNPSTFQISDEDSDDKQPDEQNQDNKKQPDEQNTQETISNENVSNGTQNANANNSEDTKSDKENNISIRTNSNSNINININKSSNSDLNKSSNLNSTSNNNIILTPNNSKAVQQSESSSSDDDEEMEMPSPERVEILFREELEDADKMSLLQKSQNKPTEWKWTYVVQMKSLRKIEKKPEYFIEVLDNYKPTADVTNQLKLLNTRLSTCYISWARKFIDKGGVEKLINLLRVTQQQPVNAIKKEQFVYILLILETIADLRIGRQYLKDAFSNQPKDASILTIMVSYLTPHNHEANIHLIKIIYALCDAPNFAKYCIYNFKNYQSKSGNGFEIVGKMLELDNNPTLEVVKQVYALTKALCIATMKNISEFVDLILTLHDSYVMTKLKQIGNVFYLNAKLAKDKPNIPNYPLELYNELSEQYKICSKVFPKKSGNPSLNPFDEEAVINYAHKHFNKWFMNVVLSLVDLDSNFHNSFEVCMTYLMNFLLTYRTQYIQGDRTTPLKLDDVVFTALSEPIHLTNLTPSSVQAHLLDDYEFYDADWIRTAKAVVDRNISLKLDDIDSGEKLETIDDYKRKIKELEQKNENLKKSIALLHSEKSTGILSDAIKGTAAASQKLASFSNVMTKLEEQYKPKSDTDLLKEMNNNNNNEANQDSIIADGSIPPPPPPPPPTPPPA